ncbi:hypothetical protein PR202_ga27328 [Eleusine coracana subsp. coracana]|uniref:non-specific serine/threonine protein kinase n=1 Tax=Eleusine coracana subsp. coracana TaxID=191504 RepID=A0AAV5DEA4_ELECO|nr:hypothetical protein QOZ80_3AG0230880 [Eleusine coracana subsp. coracana]GJN09329.1 hypothetical protein PR202_ga27328 [Eleusine coracana subsp. coracana]
MLLHRHGILCCGCGGSTAVAAGGGGKGGAWNNKAAAVADDDDANKAASARQLSWSQVEAMTCGFTSAVVGEGGFSKVYLARLAGGSLAAVKVHNRSSSSSSSAFKQELDALLRVRHHPHIVRLLGFCCVDQGGVLVLEFAPNGNLHDRLHNKGKAGAGAGRVVMPWARRVSVGLQVARALEYLHALQVVHGDVKASNVLLDASMAARLCDFGSARAAGLALLRPRAVTGSPGYVDPHYIRSGVLTNKSDVYSFGVLLLELVTGVQAFSDGGGLLTAAVTSSVQSDVANKKLVDHRLGCRYDADEAAVMVTLALACVGDNPTLRPSMADVVRTLDISVSSIVGTRSHGARKLLL